jgi:nitric oxide dioxygenase
MTLDINSLETSFDAIADRGDEVVEDFYNRIFTVAPGLRGLFPGRHDPPAQGRPGDAGARPQVAAQLGRDRPDAARAWARHVDYGAQPEHYPVVGQALIEAMANVAGDAWRPEYNEAWAQAYEVLVGEMLIGAAEAAGEEERLAA